MYWYGMLMFLCVDICNEIKFNQDVTLADSTFGKIGGWFAKGFDVCAYCEDSWKNSDLANASNYTKLLLFTRNSSNYTYIVPGNVTEFLETGFDKNKPTKLLIHGWLDTALINFAAETTRAYLEEADVNVVAVDWSAVASKFYPIARIAVSPVGLYLAQVLDWLDTEAGVPLDSIHVVGHSLGAHIGGIIGEQLTSGRLSRVSGLDPAGPGFDSRKAGRLDASDAEFVDIIHTSGGWAGYFDPCGHVDFYPNKGVINQPGCSPVDFGRCSHIRSYKLFAESISSENFVSVLCDSWKYYEKGDCASGETAIMGEHVDLSTRGKYYLRTARDSPFALGNQTSLIV